MKKAIKKQLRNVLYVLLFGMLLFGSNKREAIAATEAVYESGIEWGADEVYRGVVNTDGAERADCSREE